MEYLRISTVEEVDKRLIWFILCNTDQLAYLFIIDLCTSYIVTNNEGKLEAIPIKSYINQWSKRIIETCKFFENYFK